MKMAGPIHLMSILLTITWVSSLPMTERTPDRYNYNNGFQSNNKTLSISLNGTNITTSHLYKTIRIDKPFNRSSSASVKRGIKRYSKPKITRITITKTTKSTPKPNNNSIVNNRTKNKSQPKPSVIKITPFTQQTKVKKKTDQIQSLNSKYIYTYTTIKPSKYVTKETKNWPSTNIQNTQDLNRYKNYTSLPTRPKKKKRKPTVHKILSKWSDKPPYSNFKESWYDHGIPIPNPTPEISTYSPEHSISAALPVDTDYTENDSPQIILPPSASGTPLNHFTLDMVGDEASYETYSADEQSPNCPSVHLSNTVFGPSAKQGCSDLNIAINTHVNQNPSPPKNPEIEGESLEVAGAGSPELAVPPSIIEPETLNAPIEAIPEAIPAGAVNSGATTGGGTGGFPSFPGFPELPGLPHLPDLKNLIEFFRLIGNGLGFLRGAFNVLRPLLYIIPLLSFLGGFLMVLPFYPWWLPFLLLGFNKKQPPPPDIVLHNHVHKPIHHYDGWFWNHNTKTWSNVVDYYHRRKLHRYRQRRDTNNIYNDILTQIQNFSSKYEEQTQNSQSWKRRKK